MSHLVGCIREWNVLIWEGINRDRYLIVKYLILGLWSVAAWNILWSVWFHVIRLFTFFFYDMMGKTFFSLLCDVHTSSKAPLHLYPMDGLRLSQRVRQFGCGFISINHNLMLSVDPPLGTHLPLYREVQLHNTFLCVSSYICNM